MRISNAERLLFIDVLARCQLDVDAAERSVASE